MTSLHPQTHLKGQWSINLVVLLVILFLDGEDFLVHDEGVFMPLKGMLCSCPSYFLQTRSKKVSEQRCTLMYDCP
jgi:hypothetical protein